MANHISHASLPYPIKNARYTVLVPYLDADGDPTDPTTPDSEVSQDGGSFADAAEEVTTITGSNGLGYITLTGAETNNSAVGVAFKVASGPKATLMTLYPRNLAILENGTAGAGAAGSITLASGTYTGLNLTGCFVRTTGGTGGGGTGGANNQCRRITAYNTGTRVATVTPNWETTPSTDTTYDILLPEGILVPMLTALAPTTLARTLDVSSGGEAGVDWANVGSPTTTVGLTGTTIATTQKVDVETIKTNPVVNGGTITFPTGATLASTTNITAATGCVLSAAGVDAIWDEPLAAHTTADTPGQVVNMLTQDTVTLSTDVALGSIVGQLLDNGTAWSYDRTTDSLEAVRDRGDAAWTTATGFSTHTAADVWSVATRVLTAGTNIVLAKGVGVTGFNDIAATAIVSAGAITTSGGAVSNVTTVATLTGHTAQTGDTYALASGANGFANIKSDTAAILADTGTDGVVVASASKTGYSLTATTGLGNQTANITGNLSGSVGSVTGAVGSVTGAVGSVAAGGITAASFGAGAIDAAAVAADAANEIADAILSRNVSNVEATAAEHTLCTVILAMLEHSISGTTLTIRRTNGTTTHATKTLTTDAAADPITAIT